MVHPNRNDFFLKSGWLQGLEYQSLLSTSEMTKK